ncbi:MAG: carotenoid oxygenase family protein [Halobacteria archaeon]|nr:carotenoid oxygenase family protein [Halobacteria archaeon]
MGADYALGFKSLNDETREKLTVQGDVPNWIDGSLIRNGPAKFEVGEKEFQHWFDGLGMLRKFAFEDSEVTYSNRFLRTQAYRNSQEGKLSTGFGTSTSSNILEKLVGFFTPDTTDNTNVNVAKVGGRFMALTEVPVMTEFDPETLETIESVKYSSMISGHVTTAHPHYDPYENVTVNYMTRFSRTSTYKVYRHPDTSPTPELIGSLKTDEPAYMHSFGLTDNYVILTEFPLVVNPLSFLLPGTGDKAFIEHYEWKPDLGTRFIVMSRKTGEVVADPRFDPFFCFHHVNAFERDNEIVVDLVAFPDSSPIQSLYLDDLRSGEVDSVDGELKRYRVDPNGFSVVAETLYSGGMTLPRTSPNSRMREYRYAYGQGAGEGPVGEFPNKLVKVDVERGETWAWTEDGTYVGEPIFVPHPEPEKEDDGVVLSVALNTEEERSELLILDASSFEEVARATTPHVVPFDFHGDFYPGIH